MIVCSKCGAQKSEEEFSWKVANVRRATICKECHRLYRQQHYQNNRQKYIDKAAKWNRESDWKKFGRYGLTREQYSAMLSKYEGKCWICKEREANCIDHDHTCCPKDKSCGRCVRGLLCQWCNSILGYAKDRVDILNAGMIYLTR